MVHSEAHRAIMIVRSVARHAPWVTGPHRHQDGPSWKAWSCAGRFRVPAQDTQADVSAQYS
jgi:hypothetical protein